MRFIRDSRGRFASAKKVEKTFPIYSCVKSSENRYCLYMTVSECHNGKVDVICLADAYTLDKPILRDVGNAYKFFNPVYKDIETNILSKINQIITLNLTKDMLDKS